MADTASVRLKPTILYAVYRSLQPPQLRVEEIDDGTDAKCLRPFVYIIYVHEYT